MKDLVKIYKDLPWILKLILCIPAIEIVTSVFRLFAALDSKSIVRIVIAVLTIIPGAVFMWIVDLICVIMKGNGFLID